MTAATRGRRSERQIDRSIAPAANADFGIGADRVFDRSIQRSVDLLMRRASGHARASSTASTDLSYRAKTVSALRSRGGRAALTCLAKMAALVMIFLCTQARRAITRASLPTRRGSAGGRSAAAAHPSPAPPGRRGSGEGIDSGSTSPPVTPRLGEWDASGSSSRSSSRSRGRSSIADAEATRPGRRDAGATRPGRGKEGAAWPSGRGLPHVPPASLLRTPARRGAAGGGGRRVPPRTPAPPRPSRVPAPRRQAEGAASPLSVRRPPRVPPTSTAVGAPRRGRRAEGATSPRRTQAPRVPSPGDRRNEARPEGGGRHSPPPDAGSPTSTRNVSTACVRAASSSPRLPHRPIQPRGGIEEHPQSHHRVWTTFVRPRVGRFSVASSRQIGSACRRIRKLDSM